MAGVQIDITGAVRLALKPLLSAASGVRVLLQLPRHVDALAREMEDLRDARADLENDILAQGDVLTTRLSNQVRRWMERVGYLERQLGELEAAVINRRSGLGGSWSRYKLGRRTIRMLRRAHKLREKGRSFHGCRASIRGIEAVEAVPSSSTSIVGGERALAEIVQHVRDDSIGIVGIYGMGGVGKTTLLTKINNEFLVDGAHKFDVVIWVTVSRDASVLKIQMDMLDRLGVTRSVKGLDKPDQGDVRVKFLFKVLSAKRFLLLLDDMWEKLDWRKVGIPYPSPENGCKVVFTTRSKDVCTGMDAQRMVKVSVLNESESWSLFCQKVGTEVDLENPALLKLARRLAGKCGGLPLALITVGRAMADARTVGEWEEAIEVLSEAPDKLPGMEDEVLSLLKFSLDKLRDETARRCLLYCCLFPEDHEIDVERLVDCWIGEGFLDTLQSDGLERARNRGHGVIRKLKAACLLECGGSSGEEDSSVKMHDVVREMAVWLTGGEHDPKNTFLVSARKGLSCLPNVERWADAKRVSLMDNKIGVLPLQFCPCPNLSTLLINCNPLQAVPGGFLGSMPALLVLDLSGTDITELPKEIGLLGQLQHLNLSSTRIESLPREMARLMKLRQLDLRETYELSRIPRDAIEMMTGLQTLNLRESGYCMEAESRVAEGEPTSDLVSLEDLEGNSLCRLEELGLDILHSLMSLETLMGSERLSRCTKFLRLRVPGVTTGHLSTAFAKLVNLRELRIGPCSGLEELRLHGASGQLSRLEILELNGLGAARFVLGVKGGECGSYHGGSLLSSSPPLLFLERLRSLSIIHCHGFRELTWVGHLPCLEFMQLAGCDELEEVLSMDEGRRGETGRVDYGGSLRKLKFMSLIGLPKLRSISRQPLLFPSLVKLHVCRCPRLTKLALGPCSVKQIREIIGERAWWFGLEWGDSSSIRNTLLPYFRPSTYF